MGFSTLMYHEIRKKEEFNPEHPSTIDVKQDYHDTLTLTAFCYFRALRGTNGLLT